ncbi:MAG: VCBS repeat-containing protein [Opitutaceae bacterium]|nr:VCBS repeat-containing protein [Opitutaceae bacterium]
MRSPRASLLVAAVLAPALASAVLAGDFTTTPLAPRAAVPAGTRPFAVLAPEQTGVTVNNVYSDPRMWGDRFREFTLGALETGIAVADFDRDGRSDIYAVSKNGPCALYLQRAPFAFEDVAAAAGVDAPIDPGAGKAGAAVVDINQDGWPDLYLCRYDAPNLLFVSNGAAGGPLTFTERAAEFGLAIKDASVHASFADYDRDGDLDAYLVTNILDFSKSPQGRRDYLLRNDAGTFSDVSKAAGIWGLTQGHSAIWFDANGDGWPDLYVANDFETPDRFYLNLGDGTFKDVVDERLPHVTYFSMSADAGDINNDGHVDFVVTDMRDRTHAGFMAGMEEIGRGLWEMERVTELIPQYMWNAVYLNSGHDRFLESAHLFGMQATGWTWAARFADLDCDGRLDAFFTSGMLRNFVDADLVDRQNRAPTLTARAAVWKNAAERREPALAYRNLGDLRFEEVSAAWGLDRTGIAFGCAVADLDGDGDPDLVYASCNEPPVVVRNDTATGHRLAVRLAGRAPNLDGIGAELRLETASGVQVRQLYTERGIVASEPAVALFGLGAETAVKSLTIRWPRGQVQVLKDLVADQMLTISEPGLAPEAKLPPAQFHAPVREGTLFVETAAERGLKHVCALRPFDEFTRQRLLPRRLNGLGPALASADVNGDGHADLFVSGSSGQAGGLFLAEGDGSFAAASAQPWAATAEADDLGVVFVDVDGDGDQDLVIAAGGVVRAEGDALLNDRLYLNDGRGAFSPAPEGALPADGVSTGAIARGDFDGDGRIDLFIGGRVVPGRYPATPRSFLYRNTGGTFIDVTDELAPGLRQVGMVTAAEFADVDGDTRPDLVLALEWGPITAWRNTGRGFEDITAAAGLAGRTGWWSALRVADVDGDGRLDLVAGNVGLNTKYNAAPGAPTVLFAGVFDDSGKEQLVEAHTVDGKLMPVRGRSKLAYAFPWLPKKFPTYAAFGRATVEDIFGAERLAGVRRLEATELASGVFLSRAAADGGVRFEFQALPRFAQLAPIHAIVARDLDGDGALDLVCVGNHFGPEPSTGRFDGSLGAVLRGDGKGGFTAVPPVESGLVVPGDARAATLVVLDGGRIGIAIARCDGPVLLFTTR